MLSKSIYCLTSEWGKVALVKEVIRHVLYHTKLSAIVWVLILVCYFARIVIFNNLFTLILVLFLQVTVEYLLVDLWFKSTRLIFILIFVFNNKRWVKVMNLSFVRFAMIKTHAEPGYDIFQSFRSFFVSFSLIKSQEILLSFDYCVLALEIMWVFELFSKIRARLAQFPQIG